MKVTSSMLIIAALTAAPSAAETVGLDADTAVKRALESSPRVVAADARVGVADARIDAADAQRRLTLTTSASAAYRSEVDEFEAPLGPGGSPVVLFPNIQATSSIGVYLLQPLYLGGAVEAEHRSALHQREGSDGDRRALLGDVELETRTAYWTAVATTAATEAARTEVERASRIVADIRSLMDAGMAVQADVLAANSRVAAAELRLVQARAGSRDAVARLRSLLAIPADDQLELADRGVLSSPKPPPALDLLQTDALNNRPEIAAVWARIAALTAQQEGVRSALRPQLSAAAGWDLARPNQRHFPSATPGRIPGA
jgi:outer membrane protein